MIAINCVQVVFRKAGYGKNTITEPIKKKEEEEETKIDLEECYPKSIRSKKQKHLTGIFRYLNNEKI